MEAIIKWEKFHFQDDKEEEDEDDEGGFEEPNRVIVPAFQLLNMSQKTDNPFFQLETFDFWIGHTNFKLSAELIQLISLIDGVESLDIISPYRMVVSIAEMFKPDRDILNNIKDAVNEALNKST